VPLPRKLAAASRSAVTPVIGLIAIALLAASCSSSSTPPPEDEIKQAPPVGLFGPGGSSTSISEDDLVATLASGGIATYAEAADAEPVVAVDEPGPLSVTGWQALTMQRQLNSGRGYVGRDLDAFTAEAAGEVPISVVVAAWVSGAQTPAAGAARELMGERDWANRALDIVYPDAVLALFANDLAGDPTAAPTDDSSGAAAAPYLGGGLTTQAMLLPAPAGICSDMVNLLSSSLDKVVQSLQVQVAEGAASVVASIWNTVVSIAATAAKIAIGAFTSALLAPVTRAITLVAVLTEAATLLDPWTIGYQVAPADSLDPGTDASVTAHVNAALDFEWPADLKDCASTLTGVTLPDPGSAKDSAVTWNYQDPYITTALGTTDQVVNAAGDAMLRFATLPQDPSELNGSPVAYPVYVSTHVERAEVTKLTNLISDLLLGALPGPARAIVDGLLGPVTSATQAKLAALVSVSGPVRDIQTIRYQKNPDPVSPPEAPAEDCAAESPTTVPDGVWKGPIQLAVTGKGMTGQAFSGGNGSLKMTVKNGSVTSGTWSVNWHSTGTASEGGISTVIDVDGNIHGSAKGSAGVPFLKGQWHIHGTAKVNIGATLPLDFSGTDTEDLRIEATSCDEVTGTFIPSFNSKGSPASFSGTARWTGQRP
jgi:hypothetical protein